MDCELEKTFSPESDGQDNALNSIKLKRRKPKGFRVRYLIALLAFWGYAMSYATQFNLSIAIVGMAKPRDTSTIDLEPTSAPFSKPLETALLKVDISDYESSTPIISHGSCIEANSAKRPRNSNNSPNAEQFDWDEQEKGIILSSFFFGFVLTQLPGGIAATRFGAKWIIGIGLLLNSFLTLMIPLAAKTNTFMLVYVRFLQGLAQGVLNPAGMSLLSYWSPVEERSFLSAIVASGPPFGAAATMICSGYILESEAGWPYVFYITGAVSVVQACLWLLLASSTPSQSHLISAAEKEYIKNSIGPQNETYISPPWRKIFTSVPVLAITIASFGGQWGTYTLLNGLPSYLKTVLFYNMEENSWLSASPNLLTWLFASIFGKGVDYVIQRKWLTTIRTRKAFHGLCQFGPAALLIGAIFVECNRTIIICLIIFSCAISGGTTSTYLPNHVEVSPNFSGIIMGITSTIGNMGGFGTALTIGAFTKEAPTKANWTKVFVVSIVMYTASAILYILFASSEVQPWDKPPQKESLCNRVESPRIDSKSNLNVSGNQSPKPNGDNDDIPAAVSSEVIK